MTPAYCVRMYMCMCAACGGHLLECEAALVLAGTFVGPLVSTGRSVTVCNAVVLAV